MVCLLEHCKTNLVTHYCYEVDVKLAMVKFKYD